MFRLWLRPKHQWHEWHWLARRRSDNYCGRCGLQLREKPVWTVYTSEGTFVEPVDASRLCALNRRGEPIKVKPTNKENL